MTIFASVSSSWELLISDSTRVSIVSVAAALVCCLEKKLRIDFDDAGSDAVSFFLGLLGISLVFESRIDLGKSCLRKAYVGLV